MRNASKNNSKRIFTLNELSLRLSPALADEIGLNESIVLLQLEYWIYISDHFIEGQRWTYQSVREMQEKAFAFWSVATVARTVKSLLDKGLIIEGNYNKKSYDKTRWFALNYKELSKLRSIMIRGNEGKGSETPPFQIETPPLLQDETPPLQDETPLFQIETTIPQITPQITPETTPQNVSDDDEDVDGACTRESDLSQMVKLELDGIKDFSPLRSENMVGRKAIKFAEVNLKRELSRYEHDKLIDWCAKFGAHPDCHDPESIVIVGLESCIIKNDLSSLIAYLNTVLEDFQRNNITTVEQIYNLHYKRKNKQNYKPSPKGKGTTAGLLKKPGDVASDKYEEFYL